MFQLEPLLKAIWNRGELFFESRSFFFELWRTFEGPFFVDGSYVAKTIEIKTQQTILSNFSHAGKTKSSPTPSFLFFVFAVSKRVLTLL